MCCEMATNSELSQTDKSIQDIQNYNIIEHSYDCLSFTSTYKMELFLPIIENKSE